MLFQSARVNSSFFCNPAKKAVHFTGNGYTIRQQEPRGRIRICLYRNPSVPAQNSLCLCRSSMSAQNRPCPHRTVCSRTGIAPIPAWPVWRWLIKDDVPCASLKYKKASGQSSMNSITIQGGYDNG